MWGSFLNFSTVMIVHIDLKYLVIYFTYTCSSDIWFCSKHIENLKKVFKFVRNWIAFGETKQTQILSFFVQTAWNWRNPILCFITFQMTALFFGLNEIGLQGKRCQLSYKFYYNLSRYCLRQDFLNMRGRVEKNKKIWIKFHFSSIVILFTISCSDPYSSFKYSL